MELSTEHDFLVAMKCHAILVLAILGMACSGQAPASTPATFDAAPLEFVRRGEGGLCLEAPCGGEVTVRDDGTWSTVGGVFRESPGGSVEPGAASRLAKLLDDSWGALTQVPFTETCPTAYDGPEWVYVVRTVASGEGDAAPDPVLRELRSCTWDLEHPEAAAAIGRLREVWLALGLPWPG